jgi:hypothetical protein
VIWRIYPMAIVAGLLIGTLIAVTGAMLAFLPFLADAPDDASMEFLLRGDVQIGLLASSIASSLAAGYFAARFAPAEELLNASATGILMLAISLAEFDADAIDSLPEWLELLSIGLVLPLVLAGALIWRARTRSAR